MFDTLAALEDVGGSSAVERRLRSLLAERTGTIVVRPVPVPCVVIVDLGTRRRASAASSSVRSIGSLTSRGDERLDPQVRLLEEGAGHLDAVAGLDQVVARAMAAQVRELAAFARCRPSSWDRQPGERGAASAASRAARPAALEPVSEWAAAEVAARLRLSTRAAQARLTEAVFLVEALPATVDALEAGVITPAHATALVDLLQPVSEDARAVVEAAALERAGAQTVANLRARVRRLVARHDAAAALRRLVAAAKGRSVALSAGEDGMATLAALLPGPLARACYETLSAYAEACEVDDEGNRDPRCRDERMADCLADLILRPHGDRPLVQVDLTVVAGVDTLTGFGADADAPGEVDGDLVPAPLVRELAHTFGLLPRPPALPDAESVAGADGAFSVDWTEVGPVRGDAATEERIAGLRAAEAAAAAQLAAADADLATAIAAADRPAGTSGAGSPAHADLPTRLTAARARRREALERLLAARRLADVALAHRPRIALVDQLSGTLLALTDAVELRRAATADQGLGPPPVTDAYRPTDPLARFVRLRDRRCRFPGCRARARCADLDHQIPHPEGPTAHDNLACLCEFHHRLSHQGPGWRLCRDEDGGLAWTLPGGHTVTTHPPALGADDAPTARVTPAPHDRAAARSPGGPVLEALRNWRPGAGAPQPGIPF